MPLTDCARLFRGDVEVVGRLVEEQQVRLREHHPAEGDARLLAAGEERHLVMHLLLFEHELAKQRAKLLVLVPVVVVLVAVAVAAVAVVVVLVVVVIAPRVTCRVL